MVKLSDSQKRILTAAAKTPATNIQDFMQDIRNPMIRQKSLDSMMDKGLVNKRFTDENGKWLYVINDAGLAAVGAKPTKRVTKQSKIIALLPQEKGVTLDELMSTTGWQAHSVRGHISNLRNKKGLNITNSMRKDGQGCYRITVPNPS